MENCSSGHVDQYVLLSEWLCFQVDCTPCVFTSTLPAWNNRNLNRLCAKVSSPLVFAHVRAAGLGSAITETNCHPFVAPPSLSPVWFVLINDVAL